MRYFAAVLLVATIGSVNHASAAQSSGTVLVTAAVDANCIVGSQRSLDFGSADTTKDRIIDARADALTIACTRGASGITIGLTQGTSQGTSRTLAGPQGHIRYEVYTAPDHAVVWNLVNTVQYVPQSAQPVDVSVYGRAIAPKDTAPGSYGDVLLALVNF